MMRLIASCIWIIVVTSASAYVSSAWRSKDTQSGTPVNKAGDLVRKKTMPLNVPMIANGIVEGYIVAQFIYLADTQSLKELSVPPDDFITDEAFRALYSGQVDFNHLQKYDLQSLTKALAEKINQRLGREIIKDVLVEEFTYVPKGDISR
jgi:flagellar basal body-associated protein FliL